MSTPYDSQQVKTILAERGAQVEAYLQHCLDAIPMQGRLKEAMYYSLLAGGKRLRPVLCLSHRRPVRPERRSGDALRRLAGNDPHVLPHPRRSARDG